jgi:hypothetical protein
MMETDLTGQIGVLIERGAKPVSSGEASERYVAPGPALRRKTGQRRPGRRRAVIGGVTAGAAVAGCAAALIIAAARPGGPPHPAGPARQGTAFLTTAMVRHLAGASQSALANSGRERISYRSWQNGTATSYGTDDVTFSGSNWNYVVHMTVPGSGGQPGRTTYGIDRVVNGQVYIRPDVTAPGAPWLHDITPDSAHSAHFPQPRTLLQLLSPHARFQVIGWQVIDGVRLEHLRATRVSELPGSLTLSRYGQPGEQLSALDLWADTRSVVHEMRIELKGSHDATMLTVAFSDFGQPEVITAPANATPVSLHS